MREYFDGTPGQIEQYACSDNILLRMQVAGWPGFIPAAQQVERGLTDTAGSVRALWSLRRDYKPTPKQVERGLTDPEPAVRLEWARREDCDLTYPQLQRLCDDSAWEVRRAVALRQNWLPDPNQYRDGVADTHPMVSSVWHKRMVARIVKNPTPEQIEAGLKHTDVRHRLDWAYRYDYTPTPAQIERGLLDEDCDVREAWARRASPARKESTRRWHLKEHAQLQKLIDENDEILRLHDPE